jgi:hypothetical protein
LSAFGQAATPRMAAHYKGDRGEFWRLVLVLAAVPLATLAGIIPALIIIGPALLAWLYRPEYSATSTSSSFSSSLARSGRWRLSVGYAATSRAPDKPGASLRLVAGYAGNRRT